MAMVMAMVMATDLKPGLPVRGPVFLGLLLVLIVNFGRIVFLKICLKVGKGVFGERAI